MRSLRYLAVLLCTTAALHVAPASADEYKLQPGDVLEFVVLGANRIEQRLAIDLDGQIRVPIGGRFVAAGHTVEEVHREIVEKLKASSFPLGTDDSGRTVWDAVFPEAILLDIAEYRPVFISGDVQTPGSQPFRSGATVRQAIAVAGGVTQFRFQQNASSELLGAEEQYRSLLAKEVGIQFALARIQAELGGQPQAAFATVPDNGLAAGERAQLLETEQQTFESRTKDLAEQQATVSEGIRTIETRRGLLAESQKNLEQETRLYESELRRVEGLFSKGLTQASSLNDARRSVFLVSTRSLDTSAEVARLERELVELRGVLEKTSADRRAENLEQMKAQTLELAATHAEVEKIRQRFNFRGPNGSEPRFEIVRNRNGSPETITASLDTPLWPGDTLTVELSDVSADGGLSAPGAVDPPAPASGAMADPAASGSSMLPEANESPTVSTIGPKEAAPKPVPRSAAASASKVN